VLFYLQAATRTTLNEMWDYNYLMLSMELDRSAGWIMVDYIFIAIGPSRFCWIRSSLVLSEDMVQKKHKQRSENSSDMDSIFL